MKDKRKFWIVVDANGFAYTSTLDTNKSKCYEHMLALNPDLSWESHAEYGCKVVRCKLKAKQQVSQIK